MSDLTYPVLDNATFKRLIDMGDGTHAEVMVMISDDNRPVLVALPPALITDNGGPHQRLRVDPGQTGFFDGRQFRVSFELTITAAPIWVKLVSPIDFILQSQTFTCDHGGYKFTAYRASQGSESGTFNQPIDVWQNNFMSETPVFSNPITFNYGGSFTPTVGQKPTETERMLANLGGAAPSSGSPNTVGGDSAGERGLPAGTYYLGFARLPDSTVDAQGVWSLIFECRE